MKEELGKSRKCSGGWNMEYVREKRALLLSPPLLVFWRSPICRLVNNIDVFGARAHFLVCSALSYLLFPTAFVFSPTFVSTGYHSQILHTIFSAFLFIVDLSLVQQSTLPWLSFIFLFDFFQSA